MHISVETKFPGFEVVRTDPEFLKKFICLKDGNVEAALKAMKKYYACIHRNLDFIDGITTKSGAPVLNSDIIKIIGNRFDGVKVAMLQIRYWRPKEINLRSIQLAALFLVERYALEPAIQKHGIALIVDLTGLGFEHVWCATPKEVYRCVNAILVQLTVIFFILCPKIVHVWFYSRNVPIHYRQ